MEKLSFRKIILLFLFCSSYLLSDTYGLDELAFNKEKKELKKQSIIINNGIKRNIYDILDSAKSPKAKLLKKWFRIASQITYNSELIFFIKNTNYKVSAITEQLFIQNRSITQKEQRLFHEKFHFLSSFAKEDIEPLNQKIFASIDVHLRTMPIVSKLTKKRDIKNKSIIIKKKTYLNLLYKINYTIEGKDVYWGYVESNIDDRVGWINLRNTQPLRRKQ